jgi:uncharacterized protein (UPF0333 family)
MMKKGQVSFEFLVIYSALLSIFLIALYIYFNGATNLAQIQERAITQSNSRAVAAAINYVYLAGNGAKYNFTTSAILSSPKENITISNFTVESKRGFSQSSTQLINSNISSYTINRGYVQIRNIRGGIDIQ